MFNWFKRKPEPEPTTEVDDSSSVEQYDPYADGGARLKQLLSGSKFIYRDTKLGDDIIKKYEVGLFFKEPTPCDATAKFGGVNGNVRFLIVSSSPKDLSMLCPNPEFSHSVVGMGEIFKVIAVTNNEQLCQITVLHIPSEFRDYFESDDSKDFEGVVLQSTEQDFKEACSTNIDVNLAHDDWTKRVEHPIGLDINLKIIAV